MGENDVVINLYVSLNVDIANASIPALDLIELRDSDAQLAPFSQRGSDRLEKFVCAKCVLYYIDL